MPEQTPSAPPTAHDALAVASRRQLLAALRESATPVDARMLAQRTGLHVNTVRFHLNVLIEAGFVAQHTGTRSGPGRPQALYASVTPGVQTGGYQLLAEILAGRLEQEGGHDNLPEQAGRAWATTVSDPAAPEVPDSPAPEASAVSSSLSVATDRAVALFTELGFEPVAVPTATGSRIELHACPFLDVARRHPGVVCGVHRGLLDATVEGAADGGLTTTLTPFARPGICIADLIPRN
ncbi:helix-turn-helix transcriptional regulator [Pseudonocardia alaniniphila]|uniref:Helix-turn-helix domain-containing protein n=1 Tax=Pseudonocardia alaniniphila TaxID=75291 RepID=A0ABS9T6H0_9PSEU|nr:helix-turn-helix domain-containing protein [Pseudonocardia alaniniphila]MCH6164127.1 helix-turn-helix domain-containing protein [Pseudonocardia alaniniphila]